MLNIPAIAAPYQLVGSRTPVMSKARLSPPPRTPASWKSWMPYLKMPGRDEDQQHAADGEELGQVDPDRPGVEADAEQHRRRDPRGMASSGVTVEVAPWAAV